MPCGRKRTPIAQGWTPLIDGELRNLAMGVLQLAPGDMYGFATGVREHAIVLISGLCDVELSSGLAGSLGPRQDPFADPPYGLFVSRDDRVTVVAREPTCLGIGSAPAVLALPPTLVPPAMTKSGARGIGNWQRTVRFVCWSDNTQGNYLIAGETVTPSGNWSTIPPHRHQYDIPGEEIPYEEIYFFRFSKPQGFGVIWQFDDDGRMDQAFSLRTNDAAYMGEGYHPTVCGPGADLYHLTFISGPDRKSRSSVHPDYRFLLDEHNLENPYARQVVKG